jgi:hypothetical protein
MACSGLRCAQPSPVLWVGLRRTVRWLAVLSKPCAVRPGVVRQTSWMSLSSRRQYFSCTVERPRAAAWAGSASQHTPLLGTQLTDVSDRHQDTLVYSGFMQWE